MLIQKDKILKASCILPVSDNINVPPSAGLRHRAALGISEMSSARTFVVSEETGKDVLH
jgi:diadenylate cyclase